MQGWYAVTGDGDTLEDVSAHGPRRETADEAIADQTALMSAVRYAAGDGYLYIDRPDAEQ